MYVNMHSHKHIQASTSKRYHSKHLLRPQIGPPRQNDFFLRFSSGFKKAIAISPKH